MKLPNDLSCLRLVVAEVDAHGDPSAAEGVARALASRLDLPLLTIADPQDPQVSLTELGRSRGGWLAVLPFDPGVPLPPGGTWAEALGAWRQPTLLVVRGERMDTGLPAAFTALVRQSRVPLLGLVQWGGLWREEERRRDGLPWLAGLPPASAQPGGDDAAVTLATSLLLQARFHPDLQGAFHSVPEASLLS